MKKRIVYVGLLVVLGIVTKAFTSGGSLILIGADSVQNVLVESTTSPNVANRIVLEHASDKTEMQLETLPNGLANQTLQPRVTLWQATDNYVWGLVRPPTFLMDDLPNHLHYSVQYLPFVGNAPP